MPRRSPSRPGDGTGALNRTAWYAIINTVPYLSSIIGFCFGFGFGVGCALAVMYSIYMGGYRAAVRDVAAPVVSERLAKERRRLERNAAG